MEWFLQKLEYADPLLLGISDATKYAKDFAKLKARQIIKHTDTLQELSCPFCDEEHSVSLRENDGKTLLLLCQQGGGNELIDIERVKLYGVDTNRWLQFIQDELLGMKSPLPTISEQSGWYHVGKITAGSNGGVDVYYSQHSQTNNPPSEAGSRRIILLNMGADQTVSGNLAVLSLARFVQNTTSKKFFNGKLFMREVEHVFRRLHFDEQNGNIYDSNSLISSLNVGSPQYYFFKLLWDKWEQPVSHEEVTKYITGQIGTGTNQTYQDYANSIKFKLIKDHPNLGQFIINKTGFYLLSDTAKKKSIRKTRK